MTDVARGADSPPCRGASAAAGWWWLLAAVPPLVMGPFLLHEFGYRDDYSMLREVLEEPGKVIALCLAEGRLFYGLLLETSFTLLNGVESLAVWRLCGATFLGLSGALLARILVREFAWPPVSAAAAGVLLALLPSAQLVATWASCWPQAVAGVLALTAFGCEERGRRRSGPAARMSRFAALVLLAVAALTYQSNVLLYAVPVAAGWLQGRRWRWLVTHLVIVAAALAVAFVVSIALFDFGFAQSRRFILEPHVASKIAWFAANPLREALALFALHDVTGRTEPWYTAMQVLALALMAGAVVHGASDVRQACARGGGLLVILMTAYAVSFVASERWATYRTIWPLTGVVLVTAWYGLDQWLATAFAHRRRLRPALALPAVALAAAAAAWNVDHLIVRPQADEWAEMRAVAATIDTRAGARVFVVLPRPADTLTPVRHLDEFGSHSADGDWVAKEMLKQALRRQRPADPQAASRLQWQSGYAPPQRAAARSVIDLRDGIPFGGRQ